MTQTAEMAAGVSPGRVYSKQQLLGQLGIGEAAWQSLRDRGLPCSYLGNRCFILSDDVISLFKRLRKDESTQRHRAAK